MIDEIVEITGSGPLRGRVRVPGDKSISHRCLLLAALADGTSHLSGLSDGDDVLRTRAAIAAYGATIDGDTISGGRARLHEPAGVIDVGNSGTAMRLIAGVAASLPFLTVLVGDASIHRRPMGRVIDPLRLMGATIAARELRTLAPLCISGGNLHGIDYATPVPSAQVKGSILFAGLGADTVTTVTEATATRMHSEELFGLAGITTHSTYEGARHRVELQPGEVRPLDIDVPGDPSQAAFLVVAATLVPGSDVTIENVYVGPGRAGFVDVLQRMGADIEVITRDATTADLRVRHAALHGTEIAGTEIVDLIDEIPVLAVAGAFASGTTTFRDAGELRLKESDRIETTVGLLKALGGKAEELPDGIVISSQPLERSATVHSAGDHRIAMAVAIAAFGGGSTVTVDGFGAVETSWPGFLSTLLSLS